MGRESDEYYIYTFIEERKIKHTHIYRYGREREGKGHIYRYGREREGRERRKSDMRECVFGRGVCISRRRRYVYMYNI